MTTYVIVAIVIVVMLLLISNIRVVPQSHAMIIERLGTYAST
ncbi:MAG TPA: peptidase, partial [Treponema sp.]|nr:peptidase [Treponema sp.]